VIRCVGENIVSNERFYGNYIYECKKHNDHLHVIMEFVVVLVVHEEDISLTKTHTKSNIIN